jgi:uncharacterized membrane protein (DUF373 family)
MTEEREERSLRVRGLEGLEQLEDVIYAVIALFLLVAGAALLYGAAKDFVGKIGTESILAVVVDVLDQALLVFMIVELLHTVRITLRDRTLAAEPFLIVGLIAGVRRILILTAKNENVGGGAAFTVFWVQLLLLIVLVVAMTSAIFIWRKAYPAGEPRSN